MLRVCQDLQPSAPLRTAPPDKSAVDYVESTTQDGTAMAIRSTSHREPILSDSCSVRSRAVSDRKKPLAGARPITEDISVTAISTIVTASVTGAHPSNDGGQKSISKAPTAVGNGPVKLANTPYPVATEVLASKGESFQHIDGATNDSYARCRRASNSTIFVGIERVSGSTTWSQPLIRRTSDAGSAGYCAVPKQWP